MVEDDRTFGEALCQVLDREGYDVTLATDFRPRWKFLKQNSRWICMLVDIVMPDGVNGLALADGAAAPARSEGCLYYRIQHSWRRHEALGPILHKPVDDRC